MKRIVIAVLLAGGFAIAGTSTFAQTSGVPAASPDDNVVVCKKLDPPTGSHLPSPPTCHTKAQWKQIQADSQNTIQDIQQHGAESAMPGD